MPLVDSSWASQVAAAAAPELPESAPTMLDPIPAPAAMIANASTTRTNPSRASMFVRGAGVCITGLSGAPTEPRMFSSRTPRPHTTTVNVESLAQGGIPAHDSRRSRLRVSAGVTPAFPPRAHFRTRHPGSSERPDATATTPFRVGRLRGGRNGRSSIGARAHRQRCGG